MFEYWHFKMTQVREEAINAAAKHQRSAADQLIQARDISERDTQDLKKRLLKAEEELKQVLTCLENAGFG